jgi:DDE superfamily endonuclease
LFLLNPSLLNEWGPKTLKERVLLFHRRFGETKISTSTLGNLYKKNGVKRKVFQYVKKLKIKDPSKHASKVKEMVIQLQHALREGRRIIFTDKAMFTTATLPTKAYAPKSINITLDESLVSSPSLAVVAGVSSLDGMEAFYMHKRSIDSEGFIQFLISLLSKHQPSTFALFLDNYRVHHSKKV